jgi:hypothetical protein
MRLRLLCLIALVAVPGLSLHAQDKPGDDSSYWMKKKLEHSQAILAALAQADYEKLEESARVLAKLNQIEKFVRGRDAAYRAQLDIFRFAVEEVRKEAEHKNIDGATLAFHQMTLSCVNCHKLLRAEIQSKARR